MSSPPSSKISHAARIIFLYALAGWIVYVAWRFEVLNAAAGHPLPKLVTTLKENRAHGGSGKWRATLMTPELWREFHVVDATGKPTTRPLTGEEEVRMTQDITRSKANRELRGFVDSTSTFLLQFVVFAVLAMGTGAVIEHRRRPLQALVYAFPALIAVGGTVLAIQRGYFLIMCVSA